MKILLDTDALIWLQNSSSGGLLGKKAKEQIINAEAVYASSVSVLEINIKAMLGKLEAPETLLDDLVVAGIKNLSFTTEHAEAVKQFSSLTKHDPFDRMLLAQADTERLGFLTADIILINLGLDFVLDARK